MNSKCKVCWSELDSGFNCPNGCDQSSGKTSHSINLQETTQALIDLQHKNLELTRNNITLTVFLDSVSCLLSEGVEFMTMKEIFKAIRKDVSKTVKALR